MKLFERFGTLLMLIAALSVGSLGLVGCGGATESGAGDAATQQDEGETGDSTSADVDADADAHADHDHGDEDAAQDAAE